ncbi:hypothetical protein BBP18_09955 [Bacillus velezensis]|nr:hypothetical protein CJP14_08860 [Bacillus velezensis]OPD42228.1 hypothetical protein BVF98_14110 [Bacillus amyloliquefaciens]PII40394.1 hypothetical protein BBP18_09955 [Bacillus velezensis]
MITKIHALRDVLKFLLPLHLIYQVFMLLANCSVESESQGKNNLRRKTLISLLNGILNALVGLHALLRNKASQTLAIYFAQFSLTRVRRYVHGKGKSPYRTLKEMK